MCRSHVSQNDQNVCESTTFFRPDEGLLQRLCLQEVADRISHTHITKQKTSFSALWECPQTAPSARGFGWSVHTTTGEVQTNPEHGDMLLNLKEGTGGSGGDGGKLGNVSLGLSSQCTRQKFG